MDSQFKVLGDQNRLRILHLLMHRDLCVCEIEELLGTTQSNASRHLGKLRQEGIISGRKKAQWVHYEISPEFMKSHPLLYRYLKERMEKEDPYLKDLTALERFIEKQESCNTLVR